MHRFGQVLADQDIAYFLITPFGMASLVLVAAILIAIAVLTQASLIFVVVTGSERERPAWDAIVRATRNGLRIFAFSLHLAGRVLLLTLPFVAMAGATVWLLVTEHDINYYLSAQPPAFWIAAMLVGLILVGMAVLLVHRLLGWALALPLVLLADVRPSLAFAESERLTLGRRSLILGVMAIWALVALMLGGLVIALIEGLGRLIVPHFFDALAPLVLVLGALVALWGLLSVLSTAYNGATFALALIELAQRLGVPIRSSALAERPPPASSLGRVTKVSTLATGLAAAALVAAATGVWLLRDVELTD